MLYDQLEDVTESAVGTVPNIAMSPSRANTLMVAAMEQQAEVDRLIAAAQ